METKNKLHSERTLRNLDPDHFPFVDSVDKLI
jgi:hypothetical protein